MSDLDGKISQWRHQMVAAGFRTPTILDELEIHLREEIEAQTKSGLTEPQAVDYALRNLGHPETLKLEFAKNRILYGATLMKNPRIVTLFFLAIVLTASAWLVFSTVAIGQQALFPNDGLIGMRASNGSHVVIQNGVPSLQGTGILSSGNQYHPILIPFIAIPFAVVLGFAIMGCLSLGQSRSKPSQC